MHVQQAYSPLAQTACVPGAPLCVAALDGPGASPTIATDDTGRWSFGSALPGTATLNALGCAAGGVCIALGTSQSGSVVLDRSVAAGAGFSELTTPLGLPPGASFAGLSCSTDLDCVAVGEGPGSGIALVRSTVDGGSIWTAGTTPAGSYELSAVSCPSESHCVAVGETAGPSGGGVVLTSSNGGRTWQQMPAIAARVAWRLDGVSCAEATCSAVGTLPAGGPVVIDSRDGGTRWSSATAPARIETLDSVDCPDESDCFAAGLQPDPGQPAVIASVDGGVRWATQRVHATRGTPASIACASAASCIAEAGGGLWQTSAGGGVAPPTRASLYVVPRQPMAGQLASLVLLVDSVQPGALTPTGSVSFSSGRSVLAGCSAAPVVPARQLGASSRLAIGGSLSSAALAACVLAWPFAGRRTVDATYTGAWSSSTASAPVRVHDPGYRVLSVGGAVRGVGSGFVAGDQPGHGATTAGLASDFATGGYWTLAADGTVRGLDAPQLGSPRNGHDPGNVAVAIAGTLTGGGYYVLERDGAVLAFGDARRRGDLSDLHGTQAVTIVPTRFDTGYWLLDSAGAAHAFGAAPRLAAPGGGLPCTQRDAVGLAVLPADGGYVVACAGGLLVGAGVLAGLRRTVPLERGERLVGVALDPATTGLWLATSYGRVLTFEPSGRLRASSLGIGRLVAIAAA